MKNQLPLLIILFACSFGMEQLSAQAFVHEQSKASEYEWPTDPAVLAKLDTWQDLKFGVLIHWGLSSVPGITESRTLCSERFSHRHSEDTSGVLAGRLDPRCAQLGQDSPGKGLLRDERPHHNQRVGRFPASLRLCQPRLGRPD